MCIGQELALLELRLFLVTTTRTFDLARAYGELEELYRQEGQSGKMPNNMSVIGEHKAYQVFQGTVKPAEGMLVRVNPRFEVAY